jgi:hypothetical protein
MQTWRTFLELPFEMVRESSQIRGADDEGIFDSSDGVVHLIGDPRENFWSKALHGYSMQ